MQVFYSLFFLSVELKFWFIYNIVCFPLTSKITTLKVYEKNMWWTCLSLNQRQPQNLEKWSPRAEKHWKLDLCLEGTLEERKLNYSATFFVIERILEADREMYVSDGVHATS